VEDGKEIICDMKSIHYFFLALTIVNCSPPKNEETVTDSTRVAKDSVTIAPAPTTTITPTTPVPEGNFPSINAETQTKNELEYTITQAFVGLLNEYEEGEYETIKEEYSIYYQEMERRDSETKAWYYDTDNRLKACAVVFDSKAGLEGTVQSWRTIIYLFSGDQKLIAVYKDISIYGEQPMREVVVASNCPQCGVKLILDIDPTNGFNVSGLGEVYISEQSKVFFEEYIGLIDMLKGSDLKKNDDNYTVEVEEGQTNVPYTVIYTIDPTIYKKVIKSN
jgi:hypothetical protein